MKFNPTQLARVCGATVSEAARYVEPLNAAMEHFDITTRARVARFLANASHESRRLTTAEENLNYSAERLVVVWPKRFPTVTAAKPYAHNPEKLANKVYAGRMGNGDEDSGDGWLYRGRGLFQLTGSDNYLAAENALGMLITGDNAYRVAQPDGAAWTACWFWYTHGCNQLADAEDDEKITRVINGGLNGYEERLSLVNYAEQVLDEMEFA